MLLAAVDDEEPGAGLEVEPVVPEVVPEVVPVAEERLLEASLKIRSMAAMCISGSPVLVLACVPAVD